MFGKNPDPSAYSRKLEPWESNPRCLRSIKFHYKKGADNQGNRFSLPVSTRDKKKKRRKGAAENEALLQNYENNKNEGNGKEATRSSKNNEYKNSLINEKQLITKKARASKDQELRKHMSTLNNLKRKLAK